MPLREPHSLDPSAPRPHDRCPQPVPLCPVPGDIQCLGNGNCENAVAADQKKCQRDYCQTDGEDGAFGDALDVLFIGSRWDQRHLQQIYVGQ